MLQPLSKRRCPERPKTKKSCFRGILPRCGKVSVVVGVAVRLLVVLFEVFVLLEFWILLQWSPAAFQRDLG